MEAPRFLIGRSTDGSTLWTAIDGNAHHLESRVEAQRFAAYLAPFQTEESARQALLAAGAEHIEAEGRKRRA